MIECKEITYNQILECWYKLWNRERYDPYVSMRYKDIKCEVVQEPTPTFFGLYDDENLIGCNSGFANNIINGDLYYRSRGLWIDPHYRKKGYSAILLGATIDKAKTENAKYCWTLPKVDALPAYERFGFVKTSNFTSWDFGENCYALYTIKDK